MPNRLDEIKNACAYIEVGGARGTGYLIAPNIVVTCAHVVGRVTDGQLVGLRFGGVTCEAKIVAQDAQADCAILQLAEALEGVEPMRLASSECRRGDPWDAYGFPAITREAGHFLTGDVQDPLGKDPSNNDALVLFSREIAAGEGAPPQGFSGTPVLVGDYVVGHLKRIIPSDPAESLTPKAMMGTLYACPSRLVANLLPAPARRTLPKPQPPTSGYDPAWYARRAEAESIAMNYLEFPGTPVVLWGPYRSGKTTTLKYLLEQVRDNSQVASTIVTVNLSFFVKESKQSLDSLLKEMAAVVVQELQGDPQLVTRIWEGFGSPSNKFTRLMELHLLPQISGRLVLAIDRADVIWRQPFKEDFFSLLRGWADEADNPIWSSLRLILAVSSSPLLLMEDQRRSPFNLTDPIELSDLDDEQILYLAERYGLDWDAAALKDVRKLVGGQPYLLRVLMFRAKITNMPLNQLLSARSLSTIYANYFDQYRSWLLHNGELAEELTRFKAGSTLPAKDRDACQTLVRAGLLVEEAADQYSLRYGLYKHLFN